jgi:hypothetical protein
VEKEYMDEKHTEAKIKIYNALAAYHTTQGSEEQEPNKRRYYNRCSPTP